MLQTVSLRRQQALRALSSDLDIAVISEGIETEPQADYLQRVGSSLLPGFCFAPPLPAEELTAMLSRSPAV